MVGLDGEVKECIVPKTQSQLTHYWHVFLCLSFKCEGQKSRECSSSLARQSSQGQKGRKVSANMVGLDGEVKECIVLKTQSQLTHYWHVFLCLSFKCEGQKSRECSSSLARQSSQGQKGRKVSANMVGLDGEVKECIVLKTQSQLTHYWHVFLCLSFKCEGQKSRECSSSLARQSSQGQKGRKVSANMVGLDGEVKECIVLKTQSQLTHYWHVFLCLSFKCEGQKSRECSSSLARQSSQGQKGRKVSANMVGLDGEVKECIVLKTQSQLTHYWHVFLCLSFKCEGQKSRECSSSLARQSSQGQKGRKVSANIFLCLYINNNYHSVLHVSFTASYRICCILFSRNKKSGGLIGDCEETPPGHVETLSPTNSNDSGYDSARSYERNPTIRALLFEMGDEIKHIDRSQPGSKETARIRNGFNKNVDK